MVLVIDVHGAANIRRMFPGATTIFLLPPSVEELERRLRDYFRELVRQKFGTIYYGPEADLPYTLYYNRVLALLLNVEGVENFASLTVNGGTADVTIQAGEIPVLGEVSVT